MTTEPTPEPTTESPKRNTQFGQQIGVDDTSPPEVAHGRRAHESDLVDDGHGGVRARFARPMDHRPPPQEASWASEFGEPETGPPTSDTALPEEGPSVWDASKAREQP